MANVDQWIRSHRTETFVAAGGVVVVVALFLRQSSTSSTSSSGTAASSTGTVPVSTMDTTASDLYDQTEAQIAQLQQQMQSVQYAMTVAGTPAVTEATNPTVAFPPATTATAGAPAGSTTSTTSGA